MGFCIHYNAFVLKLRAKHMGKTDAIIEYKIVEQEIFK